MAERVKVENTFGLLKCQWRRLKNMDVNTIDRAKLITEACILLHNFGVKGKPAELPAQEALPPLQHESEINNTQAGVERREQLAAAI